MVTQTVSNLWKTFAVDVGCSYTLLKPSHMDAILVNPQYMHLNVTTTSMNEAIEESKTAFTKKSDHLSLRGT